MSFAMFGMNNKLESMSCATCGSRFKPTEEDHYVARDCRTSNDLMEEPQEYDAYDCQQCGSQIITGIRKIAKTYKEV
jgi:DNA-directed RNA polymerase subunit RPC12/RpoP